ncbi:hypothetical protein O6H91_Y097300 [Diphasiastrum complanatum]|nr:hypothetical protein O6H91_Y097300 [Diphasiastrum complanatum]KAJ7296828.1 hypothetical protein O6H91_Y097300 [Diphasiastrum complanatum]
MPSAAYRMCHVPPQTDFEYSSDKQMAVQANALRGSSTNKTNHPSHSGRLTTKACENGNTTMIRPLSTKVKCQSFGEQWYMKLLVLWVIAGIIASMWVFYSMNADIVKRRRGTLSNMCEERAWMLQDQFVASMNHVRALTALVTTFALEKQPSALDQTTFAAYTARTSFERPLMSGVAYAQRVLHPEREAFEKAQGWIIKRMHSNDVQPARGEYAPTVLTQETLSHLASLDMMSGEEDCENILRARASGKGALTGPFRLLESNHLGVVLTFTVYKRDLSSEATEEERIQATAGYVGGAFDFESLVENLLRQLAGSQAIIVNVYDITNKSRPLVMYGPNTTDTNEIHVSSLEFGDPVRKHEMRCRFYDPPSIPWSAITTSSGILVIVLLVAHILYAAVNRIEKVEEDYRKMEELKVRAESADIAKSQFLATVSHEIRTPMNGVLGMLQMLKDTDLNMTQKDYAHTAHESGKQLIKLINEVLDQAKIESGRMELESVPFDLRVILDDILSLFSAEIKDKRIELAVFVSKRVPDILVGDPVRLHQIITNLVGNSVKFTEQGHIFVCVHLAEDVDAVGVFTQKGYGSDDMDMQNLILSDTLSGSKAVDGRNSWSTFELLLKNEASQKTTFSSIKPSDPSECVNLVFTVEDTGVGIPLLAQERVFTPFMQADSSTSRNYGGTGIGLSISRYLVELMKGKMDFASQPNVGTTFSFRVPVKRGEANMLELSKSPHLKPRHPQFTPLPTNYRGMKALVLDGRPVRAQVTRYHLERLGIQVEISNEKWNENCGALSHLTGGTSNGGSCVQKIRSVDMIFVDKDAWGLNSGLDPQFLEKFGSKGMPKMILLAILDESHKATEAGYVKTIVKPLRASIVDACLQQVLGHANSRLKGKEVSGGPGSLHKLLSDKLILVVDDNKVNRRVAEGALRKFGALVECVESGKAAISKLQPPHKFDACFMDVQMPEMDG